MLFDLVASRIFV